MIKKENILNFVNMIFLISRTYSCDFLFIFSKKWFFERLLYPCCIFQYLGYCFQKSVQNWSLFQYFLHFLSLILPIYLYPLPRNMDQNLHILLFILRDPIMHFATLQEIEYTPNQGYHLSYMCMIHTFRIFAWFRNIRGVKNLYLLFFYF